MKLMIRIEGRGRVRTLISLALPMCYGLPSRTPRGEEEKMDVRVGLRNNRMCDYRASHISFPSLLKQSPLTIKIVVEGL